MLPSSLILWSSSSKISSSDWLMYLARGGWGNRLCWREKSHVKREDWDGQKNKTTNVWNIRLCLTSSLISFRMEGCSSMCLNMVPTIIHCSPICRSHSFLMGTTQPATHIHSCSEAVRIKYQPVSEFMDVSHPTSPWLCRWGCVSSAWVWWRRCVHTGGWSCARRGGIAPSSRCMRAADGQTRAPLSLEEPITSPSARSRLRTWLTASFGR